jgi:hypothetical protein
MFLIFLSSMMTSKTCLSYKVDYGQIYAYGVLEVAYSFAVSLLAKK